jgi:hypothetical protein
VQAHRKQANKQPCYGVQSRVGMLIQLGVISSARMHSFHANVIADSMLRCTLRLTTITQLSRVETTSAYGTITGNVDRDAPGYHLHGQHGQHP